MMSEQGDGRLPGSLMHRRDVLVDESFARYRGFALVETHQYLLPLDVTTQYGGRVELRHESMRVDESSDALRLRLNLSNGERPLVRTRYRIEPGGTLAVRGSRRGDEVELYLVTCDRR